MLPPLAFRMLATVAAVMVAPLLLTLLKSASGRLRPDLFK
jgi:hypothetical protein